MRGRPDTFAGFENAELGHKPVDVFHDQLHLRCQSLPILQLLGDLLQELQNKSRRSDYVRRTRAAAVQLTS